MIAVSPKPLEPIESASAEPYESAIEEKLEPESPPKPVEKVEVDNVPAQPEKPKFDPKDAGTWPKCDDGYIVRADNGECMKRSTPVKPVAPKPAPATPTRVASTGSGDCAAEIRKYNWNQTVAYNVMFAESGGRAGVVNNSPRTRDYSVGCFQINLYGANARNRPSEAWLKNAANNVSYAHQIYVANGHSFVGQWGVCRSMVSCY